MIFLLYQKLLDKQGKTFTFFKKNLVSFSPGEDEDLGPPPSVDEAADALMTRLGFLLGEKIITGEAGSSYHGQDDGQVISEHAHTLVLSDARCAKNAESMFLEKILKCEVII